MNILNPREQALKRLCQGDHLSFDTPRFTLVKDRGLYQELVRGVMRHRLLLDWHIRKVIDRRLSQLSPAVLNCLRMGLYQILFLRVPDYAVVSESVELISRNGNKKAKGFVNATLRNFLRKQADVNPPKENLSLHYSFPEKLLNHFRKSLVWSRQTPNALEKLLKALNEPLPLCLRINRLQTTRDQFQKALKDSPSELQLEPTRWSPYGIKLRGNQDLTRLPGYDRGDFIVQSESSQLIAPLLGPFKEPLRILDACAAPGGKTTHLAELQRDQGEIIALAPKISNKQENRSQKKLAQNIDRLQLQSIQIIEETAEEYAAKATKRSFDRILVDAPCTGLGTIVKYPERKWLFKEKHVEKLVKQQQSILRAVEPLLKDQGVLVYSVCSLSLAEWQAWQEFSKQWKGLGPPDQTTISWSDLYDPQRKCFFFWPQKLKSEGLFAVRLGRT